MKAQAHHHAQPQWHLWMPFSTALLMVNLTAAAWGEANTPQTKSAAITDTKPYGQFPLLLSTTLSIPVNKPVQTAIPPKIAAAQDSIEKEKILADLNTQIAAMEQLIQAQRSQIEGSRSATGSHETLGNSAVVSAPKVSSGSADNRMAGVSKSPSSEIVAPPIVSTASREGSGVELLQMLGLKQVMGLVLIVLALLGLVWHRRHHQLRQQAENDQKVLLPWEHTLKIPAARQDKAGVDLDMTEVQK